MNRNAYIGRNVEILFKNSVGDNPAVIRKLREHFKIQGRYLNSVSTGVHSEKADVKMEFADGHNIDANVKARNKKRDKEVNRYYKLKGWKVVRVWEHTLKPSR